jgi:uncharacterized surface protein with fasciclin (FAS1) repeats
MKGSLPLALIVTHLILQSAVLNIVAGSQQKPAAEEFRCGAGVTIAGCITGAAGQGKFITFAKLAKASGLEEVLKGPGPYTVFVPTDEAFSALPTKTIEELSAPANREQLRDILYLHAIRADEGHLQTQWLRRDRSFATGDVARRREGRQDQWSVHS